MTKTPMDTGFFAELAEQPQVLLRCLEQAPKELSAVLPFFDQIRRGILKRIVFSGMGGSFAAAHICALRLIEHGIPAFVVEASELLYYQKTLLNSDTLLVLISQSGYSVEVVRLLDQISSTIPIIGITNDPASDLGKRSTVLLTLQAGEELTVSTKTYTATVALLHLLGTVLINGSLQESVRAVQGAAEAIQNWLPYWKTRAVEAVQLNKLPKFAIFLGRGFSRASMLTGALIVKETAKFPTEGIIGGQFRHGPIEVIEPGITVVMFANPGRTDMLHNALSERISSLGGHVISIGTPLSKAFAIKTPDCVELLAPLIEIVPVQYLAASWAAERGFEVGAFRYSQKVTVVE